MELYFLRHAEAVSLDDVHVKTDFDRYLTSDGKNMAKGIGQFFERLDIKLNAIFSSPYPRAWETGKIIARQLGIEVEKLSPLAVGSDPEELIRVLNSKTNPNGSFLLIGHEPQLSQLMSFLISGDASIDILFKKSTLSKLYIERLYFGRCAQLRVLIQPDVLKNFLVSK